MRPKYFLCFLLIFSMLVFAGCMGDTDKKDKEESGSDTERVEERIGDDVRDGAHEVREKIDDMTGTGSSISGTAVSGAQQAE